ncbi:MAG: hypothetical protein ACRDWH_06165, partial [Acidimicrobiia bacterium]
MEASGTLLTTEAGGWRHYVRLVINSFATMLDLGLFTLGAALVGLGLSVLLGGLEIVGAIRGLSTGAVLVSALVLGVAGTFSMGIASEGPVRRASSFVPSSDLEQMLARALSAILVGVVLIFVADRLVGFSDDLAAPLMTGIELVRTTGTAGLWPVPFIGVPLAWGMHRLI